MANLATTKKITKLLIKHLRILAGAMVISIVFSLILFQKIFNAGLLNTLIMTFIQLELFLWLGIRFFRSIDPESAGFRRKTIVRFLLFYLTVLLIACLLFLLTYLYHFTKSGYSYAEFFPSLLNSELQTFVAAILIGFGIGALFFFYTQWTDAIKRMQKLKEEKLIFQYETLKTQVNPHFLFNSLNTLSSLVNTNAGLSEKFIQKLSAVYRYVLEHQDKDLVTLSSEMQFVKDFFYLQKIRDGEKIELKVDFSEMNNIQIMPVSIQMLVENAIKHNVATRAEPLHITIHFEGMDKLVVRNDLRQRMQLSSSSKIGLKNLNERCKLILKREIEVQETRDEFIVRVPLKLTKAI